MAAPTSGLPDVNAETYPFERVQHWLDETANFNLYAVPERTRRETATVTPANPADWFGLNGGYGIDIKSSLHQLETPIDLNRSEESWRCRWSVGEEVGIFRARCLFGSEELHWAPGMEPPPAIYDPWRQRKFALLDAQFDFSGNHRIEVYGIGRTFPLSVNGEPRVYAAAVGNITRGWGRFQGRQGTFVMTGRFTRQLGFAGQITCRVLDHDRESVV